MNIEKRLEGKGIKLATPGAPKFSYVSIKQYGDLLYTSGHDCQKDGELLYTGTLGKELSVEEGKEAAKQCIINILSTLKAYLGDLDKIDECIKLLGFVQSTDDFKNQPQVMNGASDFLIEILGEKGKHARSAIGTNTLPFNTPVEIELIVKLKS
ncbi:RidA family protein [Providencia rettgeri]|uniref:RidA family protein n=1 Tax=Providencia TaxID=586 RepID=UPI00065DE7E8|nr:RidA family protein [Providencia rettgeri]ELR5176628.1 RidA family protein [Providencia rettgeri]ELR5260422.1 RidA family protein [Providencia rettgeri]MDK3007993.1 RidA family protein [Providencia rettgeri]